MATFDELAERYARKLQKAAIDDGVRDALGLMKCVQDWGHSKLANALVEVGNNLANLTFTESGELLDDDDWQDFANRIAKKLGSNMPKQLRRLLEERSLDALMAMCHQIETLYQSLRK